MYRLDGTTTFVDDQSQKGVGEPTDQKDVGFRPRLLQWRRVKMKQSSIPRWNSSGWPWRTTNTERVNYSTLTQTLPFVLKRSSTKLKLTCKVLYQERNLLLSWIYLTVLYSEASDYSNDLLISFWIVIFVNVHSFFIENLLFKNKMSHLETDIIRCREISVFFCFNFEQI